MFDRRHEGDRPRAAPAAGAQAPRDLWLRLRIQHVDKNTPSSTASALEKAGPVPEDDDPRYVLEERNYLGGKLKAFTEKQFQPIYRADDGGIGWHTFGEALFYERIIAGDRSELANPRGISPTRREGALRRPAARLTPEQRRVLRGR